MATNSAINTSDPIVVGSGGTGAATFTSHGILAGGATTAITATAELTNGQILVGSTGNAAVAATITAGTGVVVTNAAGAITLALGSVPVGYSHVSAGTYTLALTDAGTLIRADACTITIPTNTDVPFPIGTHIWVEQLDSGAKLVKFAGAAGVTVYSTGNLVACANSEAVIQTIKLYTNTWIVFGKLA